MADVELYRNIIIAGTGCHPDTPDEVFKGLVGAMAMFKIDTPKAVAAFLANIGVESQQLTKRVENLNYSAERLAAVWPFRFAVDPHVSQKVPNAKAKSIARQPETIANVVYGGRGGNDSEGDGWKYRGRGFMQTTFKDNYRKLTEAFGKQAKVDFVKSPDLLEKNVDFACAAAAYYFASSGCIEAANAGKFDRVVKLINGAPPSTANHGPLRQYRYERCLAAVIIAEAEVKQPAFAPSETTKSEPDAVVKTDA